MRRGLQAAVGAAVVGAVAVSVAKADETASPYGTWIGTPRYAGQHGPHDLSTPIKLIAAPASVRIESTGPTTASHDAPEAKSTCTTRYRFNKPLSSGGWLLYVLATPSKLTGAVAGGPPSGGICSSTPFNGYRDAVRLRPAGAKLKVEFGYLRPVEKAVRPSDFDPANYKSGYLHH